MWIKRKFSFSLVETDEEKEDVYRFRYNYYYKDIPELYGTDAVRQRVWSRHDNSSYHFVCKDSGQTIVAVGTATNAQTPELPCWYRDIFEFDRLSALSLDKILIFSRLVIHPAWQKSTLFLALFVHCAQYLVQQGFLHAIHYCSFPLVPLYERLGYRIYGRPFAVTDRLYRIPMILSAVDSSYLQYCHPSFRKIVGEYDIADDKNTLYAVLPELRRRALCCMTPEDRILFVRFFLPAELQNSIPEEASGILKKTSVIHFSRGDAPYTAETNRGYEPPLLWFVLAGAVDVFPLRGKQQAAGPGDFINAFACNTFICRADTVLLFWEHNILGPDDDAIGGHEVWEKIIGRKHET